MDGILLQTTRAIRALIGVATEGADLRRGEEELTMQQARRGDRLGLDHEHPLVAAQFRQR